MIIDKENRIKEKVLEGLDLSYKRLIKSKRERNLELIVSENGEVIRINPHEIICE